MRIYVFVILTLFFALYAGLFLALWLVVNMTWWGALILATLMISLIVLPTIREVKAPYLTMRESVWKDEDHDPL